VDGPALALQSATSVNADLIGRADLGRVQEGCVADLLVVDANPLDDPSVLWSSADHRTIVRGGTII